MRRLALITIALSVGWFAATAVLASAAEAAPAWKVRSFATSHAAPDSTHQYLVRVRNVGDATTVPDPVTGAHATMKATLPTGITGVSGSGGGFSCPGAAGASVVTCTRVTPVVSGEEEDIVLRTSVATGASGVLTSKFEASGGGAAAAASVLDATIIAATPPGFGIAAFDGEVLDPNGDPFTQAGGHPAEASTTIEFNSRALPSVVGDTPGPFENAKNIEVELPPGFVGDPTATPTCNSLETLRNEDCPDATQVGFADITFLAADTAVVPIYNMKAPPDVPARFGFSAQALLVLLDGSVRSDGDYGLNVTVRNISEATSFYATKATFWGVPADPSHDSQRGFPRAGNAVLLSTPCAELEPSPCSNSAGVPAKPFLTLPTSCTAPGVGLEARLRTDSWQNPGVFKQASFISHLPPNYPAPSSDWGAPQGPDGCDRVPFEPEIEVTPRSTKPDSPAGYSVDVRVPHVDNPDGIVQSHLKTAVVTLPEGVTMNPSAAEGLEACSNEQIGLNSKAAPTCPEASRIGTVEVVTPLLADPLKGSVFVGSQLPDDRYRIFMVIEGPGVIVKLKGSISPDPQTGQLTTTFLNNPQLPFESLHVEFKGGPRAPLANPPTCGMKIATTELTPWSGNAAAHPSDSFNIDCPGISGFGPLFDAGTLNPAAGAYSPFALRINRSDGQEYMGGLSLEFPPGLIANLRGVPLCSNADANAGTCDIASKIGTAVAGAGAGDPFYTAPEHGSVYLTEGYKGAPYGLSTAVRAIAGPFDLGMVVTRQAIFVDRTDAHITVVSDPLPTIVEGVPLRLRSINVDVNRPGFMINPTSCGEKQIKATITSTVGTVHEAVQRFQAGDCQALPLKPKFRMRLTGRKQMRDGGHPGLRTVVTQGFGQANMKKVAVHLPLSLALDPENAQSDALCEFEAGQRVDCPASSIIGRAVAHTPVLNRPLTGPVHFVKNVRIHPRTGRTIRTLPTLLIPLRGEVAIDVRANSDVIDNKLVSTFHTVPDAPVSRFVLTLKGGRKGILVVTRNNVCRRPRRQIADVLVDGQNGKRADQAVRMRTPCKKRKRAARLKLGAASWDGDRLAVAGRLAKGAKRRVKVKASCGTATVSRRVKPKRGSWKAILALPSRCAGASRAKVTATYPGGPKLKRATASRRVTRRT